MVEDHPPLLHGSRQEPRDENPEKRGASRTRAQHFSHAVRGRPVATGLEGRWTCVHSVAMARPRIVYLHGDHTVDWRVAWVPSVKATLEQAGYETFFELLPDSVEARAEYWLPFLEQRARAGRDDVLLGWSCGAVAAMRYAQTHAVRGLVLIAPYYTDLGLPEVRKSGFVVPAWDWERVRANAGTIHMFQSDADPYVSQAELASLARHLGAAVTSVPGAGHFADLTDFDVLVQRVVADFR